MGTGELLIKKKKLQQTLRSIANVALHLSTQLSYAWSNEINYLLLYN